MVVREELPTQAPDVRFIESNDMIEALTAGAAYPKFRNAVLPGATNACAHRLDAGSRQQFQHLGAEFGIAVQDSVPYASGGKSLSRPDDVRWFPAVAPALQAPQ